LEWVALAIAVPLLLVAGLAVAAWLLPVHQLSRRSRDLSKAPDQVWHVLTDFQAYPQWRRQVRSIMRVPSAPHEELWRESYGNTGLTLRTEVEDHGRVLLRHVVGNKLEFGGVWRFELTPLRHGGTRLTIIEAAEYYRPLHRLVARYITGEGRNLDLYLADLARELQRQEPHGVVRTALA
jgi:hypothetical protein